MRPAGADALVPATLSVWLLLAVAWFATIGIRPLLEPDEARYAEIPREMAASSDWLTPRLNGFKYFEKPPLQYWATAAIYSVFGFSEWAARFWAFALAFLCIPMTYAFARHLYESDAAGVAAASALTINPYFAIVGQLNLLDSGFCFFLTAAIFCFLRAGTAAHEEAAERRWMLLASAALALAVLSKGVAALVLVGSVMLIHLVLTRQPRPWRRWHFGVTVPAFLAITLPWFGAMSVKNPEFPGFFFIHEHFARYLTTVSDRVEPWWYFGPVVLLALLPWLGCAWPAAREARVAREWDSRSSAVAFLAIWCIFVLLFFSASHSKLATYVMPLMPALAVLLAPTIVRRRNSLRHAAWAASGIVLVTGVGLLAVAHFKTSRVPADMAGWVAAAVLLTIGAAAIAKRRWFLACAGVLLGFQALMVAYTLLPPVRTTKALVSAVRGVIGPETKVFSVGQYRQSVAPYLGRTLRLVSFRGEMDFGIRHAPAAFVPTVNAFVEEWQHSADAVAFVEPGVLAELKARNLPMQVIARDGRSVVVVRAPAADASESEPDT